MKHLKIYILLFFLLSSFFGFSQEGDITEEKDTIYVYAEKMPEYPGGVIGLKIHVAENLVYPKEAINSGIVGTVFVRFEVTKTGEIGKVEIQRAAHPLLDAEAVRVIKTLSGFEPGLQKGKPVNVWYSMPVSFRLN
jgi:periplasmic protein TonB